MVGRGSVEGHVEHRRTVGVHLMPIASEADRRRPSIVVELDAGRRVIAITPAVTIDDIVAALPADPALVAVDAPIAVANDRGRRDLDDLLAWLDVPVFPASRARLTQVYGGIRGEALAASMASRPASLLVEAIPDLVLRLLAWHGLNERGSDLAAFRAAWLGLRPQPFRPKGLGRARPSGIAAAVRLLADHVDLGDWTVAGGDDFAAIADAAVVDAVLCAYSSWCAVHGDAVLIASAGARCALPTAPALSNRIAVNVARLAAEGHDLRICAPAAAA